MLQIVKHEYISYDELYCAYLDCRRRKRATANEITFEINENVKLYNLWVDLNTKRYKVGRSICFIVDRPVPREVFAADFIDRIVHHLFINRILKYVEQEFIEDTYSCRVGKGTQYGVKKCYQHIKECSNNYTEDCYILKCDLKSFFITINKDILYERLKDFITEKCGYDTKQLSFMLYLFSLILYNNPVDNCIIKGKLSDWDKLPKEKSLFHVPFNNGLPIGNLTSQIFANFYLSGFDHFITDVLGYKHYGRYVDDFFVVSKSKEELTSLIVKMREYLEGIGVILHPKKIYIQHYTKGIKFIGHVIKPNRIYIGNRTKGNFYETVNREVEIFNKEEVTNTEVEHFVSCVNSYLGFMNGFSTYNIRKKILKDDNFSKFYHIGHTNVNYNKISVNRRKENYSMAA